MDSATYDKFTSELMQGIGSFLGLPANATTSFLTDLLYSLDVQVKIMQEFNNQPENRTMTDALDCLQTVSEKMPKARILRSYTGRLAGTEDAARREQLLAGLKDLLANVKKKQKRLD